MPEAGPAVIVFTPIGRDAELTATLMKEMGSTPVVCATLNKVIAHMPDAACAIVAQEGMLRSNWTSLSEWIAEQPPWSDFPFVLLTMRPAKPEPKLVNLLGNVTILERPFHPSVLLSAVQAAQRARGRQFQARAYLEEQRRSEANKELLIRELHHRVKNTLAIVVALIRSGARSSESIDTFAHTFSERIWSLGRTHGLLIEGGWRDASLRDMLANELSAFTDIKGPRVRLEGPTVMLSPELAVALGMAFHELATNAVKYGAFSTPLGRLTVSWATTEEQMPRLNLRWQERDGPAVVAPVRAGFGTELIGRLLVSKQAQTEFTYEHHGFAFRLSMPLHPFQAA